MNYIQLQKIKTDRSKLWKQIKLYEQETNPSLITFIK